MIKKYIPKYYLDNICSFISKDLDISMGIVHGDYHPGNIIMNKSPKIIDWGRSRLGDIAFDIGYFAYSATCGTYGTFNRKGLKSLSTAIKNNFSEKTVFKATQYYLYSLLLDIPWLVKESRELMGSVPYNGESIIKRSLEIISNGEEKWILE